MRYCDSILGSILKAIPPRWFSALVDRCGGDAYDKEFSSWDHLLALVYAQLAGGHQPARAGSGVERQRPSPLPSQLWCAGAFDPVRCQRSAALW